MNARSPIHLVLVSGGLDSATALMSVVRAGHRVRGLFVDYGQLPVHSEHAAAVRICAAAGVELDCVTLPSLPVDEHGVYFGRNALLVMLGAARVVERPLVVTIGLQLGPPFYDASAAFVGDMQHVLDGYGGGAVQVSAPLEGMDKRAVLDLARHLGVPVGETYSCERRDAPPCMECASCLDRGSLGV